MRSAVSVLLVLLLVSLVGVAWAQVKEGAGGPVPVGEKPAWGPPVAGQPGVAPPMKPQEFRPMPMPPVPPVVTVFEDFLFIIMGNAVFKLDPRTMEVVGVTTLTPPPPPLPMMGEARPLPPEKPLPVRPEG